MNDTVTAIIEHPRDFYLFDSYGRYRQGLADSDGSSVLLKFSRLEHVQNYTEVTHLEYQGRKRQYFQVLFLDIQVDIDNMSEAIFQINRTVWKLKKNKSTAKR